MWGELEQNWEKEDGFYTILEPVSDPGLEPGDARLVELTLAVHDILLPQFILSQSNSDRLCGLPAKGILMTWDYLDGKVSRGSFVGLDLMVP